MNMTETTKPQAGQWWEHVSGLRLLAVSREKPGWIWALFAMDKPPVQVLDQWEDWKHLPDCTGFDWAPEKPICVMCGVNAVVAGTAGCEVCNEYAMEATGCPVIPEQAEQSAERVPVRLFHSIGFSGKAFIGDVYVADGPIVSGDREIHSDGNGGWFVEVTK